jgi:dTMP kinase
VKNMLVVIGGSDFSGKETQSNLLYEHLVAAGLSVHKDSFPKYETPTGKIVGGPLLGKEHICHGFFPEGGGNVPAKVAAMYYVADRMYNIGKIEQALENHDVVILDRYVESNMAHQAGKLPKWDERDKMFEWLSELEYGLCGLPRPDIGIVLYVPYDIIELLRRGRQEKADEVERDKDYLVNSIAAYLEMARKFGYHVINCTTPEGAMLSKEDVGQAIFDIILEEMSSRS